MGDETEILFWRRTDIAGLERLTLSIGPDGVLASSTVIVVENGGFRLDHRWKLTPGWRAISLDVERWSSDVHRRLSIERAEGGWRVDGQRRADLDGAEEPDLSITPFCNTLPIRRTPAGVGASLTLDTCFVDAATMRVTRSRQRYDRLAPDKLRYVDLGLSAGFEADINVDARGLVVCYQHLFERVAPA